MKRKLKTLALLLILVSIGTSLNSCSIQIRKSVHSDKKGWNKNSNNPHHPQTTNPGHTKKDKKKKNKK